MARTNIEERCYGDRRLHRFAQMMKWNVREALGCLAHLWHESQERLAVTASSDEIAEWCWAADPDEGRDIVDALCASGWIDAIPSEKNPGFVSRYLIRGNQEQIDQRIQLMDARKKGGAATKRRWATLKKQLDQGMTTVRSLVPVPQAKDDQDSTESEPESDQENVTRNHCENLDIPENTPPILENTPPISPKCRGGSRLKARQSNSTQGKAIQCSSSVKRRSKYTVTPIDHEIGDQWIAHARDHTSKPLDAESFAMDVCKIRTRLNLDDATMRKIVPFLDESTFWSGNFVFPKYAFKTSARNGRPKIENLLNEIRRKHKQVDDQMEAIRILDGPEAIEADFVRHN